MANMGVHLLLALLSRLLKRQKRVGLYLPKLQIPRRSDFAIWN